MFVGRLAMVAIVLTAVTHPGWAQQPERDLLYVGVPNNAFANFMDRGGSESWFSMPRMDIAW